MKYVYLIRHGESSHNADNNRLSGSTDVPLTDQGVAQCASMAGILETLDIEQIIASPLQRSKRSAELFFPNRRQDILESPLLTEFDYGDYEGIDPLAQPEDDPVVVKWNTDPSDLKFPNGGSIPEHAEKAYEGLLQFIEDSNHESTVFVSHRTTIRLLVALVMKIPLKYFRAIPCDNCAITKLKYNAGTLSISMLNALPTYLLKE